MSEASPSPVAPSSKRVEFVDLLRGWAVIVMIETHVVNATLTAQAMESDVFQWVKFFNGLVAPSFLFASGLAYAITTHRKAHDYLALGKPLIKQLSRLLLILLIGYILHLPEFSYTKLMKGITEEQWLTFLQVDVLQCIAVTLLMLQFLLLMLRSEKALYIAAGVLSPILLFGAPLMWGVDFLGIVPAPLAAYLNGLHFSLFPLFPWSFFLLTGAVTGHLYNKARQNPEGEKPFMKSVLLVGIGLILISFVLDPVASSMYPTYDHWRYGPPFVLLRLGIVMVLLAGMSYYERHVGVAKGSAVTLVGRESLLVYAVHLLLIYGDFGSFNYRKEVNHTYGASEAIIATLALLLLMYALAFAWSKIKRESPRLKVCVNIGVVVGMVLVFFFGPGE